MKIRFWLDVKIWGSSTCSIIQAMSWKGLHSEDLTQENGSKYGAMGPRRDETYKEAEIKQGKGLQVSPDLEISRSQVNEGEKFQSNCWQGSQHWMGESTWKWRKPLQNQLRGKERSRDRM